MNHWFCIMAKPNQEKIAADNLKDQDYEVFLPKHQVKRRHARKLEIVSRPLFPGYLFVQFDRATTQWRPIRGTRGCIGPLMAGDEPAAVPDHVIEGLKRRIVGGFVKLDVQTFKPGEKLRVTDGPFRDHSAIFSADMDDDARVHVLINLLGRQVRVPVPVDMLEAS